MRDSESWSRIEALFHDALERAPAERSDFLDERCGGDADLRREVDELLAADDGELPEASAATFAGALESAGVDPELGRRIGSWTLESVLGTGGMGRVYLATRSGADFEQRAAVKLIRRGLAGDEILTRFRQERATLARLEHPGIARLLDGGATDDGLPWLAMEYVEGEVLDAWCDTQRLDVPARLALFADVCDAVAFAHRKLVVHRDLKPANILVDGGGMPRLLDFGVAKVLDADEPGVTVTRTGGAPMTPAYSSPEQVQGEPVGVACDVYALGVILYELLTGRRPYRDAETSPALARAILEQEPARPSTVWGRRGGRGAVDATAAKTAMPRATAAPTATVSPSGTTAPTTATHARDATALAAARSASPETLRRRLRGDLDNIVLLALAKEPEQRYASAADLADDVRRHLAGLPVAARAPSAAYRLAKFVRRHRAAAALTVVLLVVAAVATTQYVQALRRDQAALADILRLSDGYRLDDLIDAMNGPLWPAVPAAAEAMDEWIAEAAELVGRRPLHAARLAELEGRLAAGADDADTLWWHAQLSSLVSALAAFDGDDPYAETLAAMRARRGSVDDIVRASVVEPAADWERAIASIADEQECPQYGGLTITPQWGLVPLRRDPVSGLWEFWVVPTGEAPGIDADDRVRVTSQSALVLVLLPGGRAIMGSHRADASRPYHDASSEEDEWPLHVVELDPFFISKYEMTQAQWEILTGSNPSDFQSPEPGERTTHLIDARHPVEQMSWDEAHETLRRAGLVMPTEAQWEYACRAGTTTPWSSGADVALLDTVANLADLSAHDYDRAATWNYDVAIEADLRDGYTLHAPVGTFAPNAFGLHDVHGNVWEWCLDMPAPYFAELAPGTGARIIPPEIGDEGTRILRGGAFSNPPHRLRSATRWDAVRTFRGNVIGLRPARPIGGETAAGER